MAELLNAAKTVLKGLSLDSESVSSIFNRLTMISVKTALELVESNIQKSSSVMEISTKNALGEFLAEDVYGSIDLPSFRQSVMDGYALCLHDTPVYSVIGEVRTGSSDRPLLNPGQAVRIFTGAPVPDKANAVVMQEYVNIHNGQLEIQKTPSPGQFIRKVGEQIQKGGLALSKNTLINPATIGYLSALGMDRVKVYTRPRINLLVTGDELRPPGTALEYGQIYDSNSFTLEAAIRQCGFQDVGIHRVEDDPNKTKEILKSLLTKSDFLLVSGGISVGDHDYVGSSLKELGVDEVFYKVKQKPGKPLFFGEKNEKYVFALPGNPASSLSCFYLYVLPALNKWTGSDDIHLPKGLAQLTGDYVKDNSRTHFLKGRQQGNEVSVLDGQASSMIHSFAAANVLIHIPEEVERIEQGGWVETILLPW